MGLPRRLSIEDREVIRVVAKKLRELRRERKLSQQEVIQRLEARSQGYMSELENGSVNMSLGTVARVARILGYDTIVTFIPKEETE